MEKSETDDVVTMSLADFTKLCELMTNLDASLARMREASEDQAAALNRAIELLTADDSTAGCTASEGSAAAA
jgi:hypothetical protein